MAASVEEMKVEMKECQEKLEQIGKQRDTYNIGGLMAIGCAPVVWALSNNYPQFRFWPIIGALPFFAFLYFSEKKFACDRQISSVSLRLSELRIDLGQARLRSQ